MPNDLEDDGFVTVHVSNHHAVQGERSYVSDVLTSYVSDALIRLATARGMEALWAEHRLWSDATFGLHTNPIGPLKHLSKEALEAAADPTDITEYADCLFLLWDAVHRAGFTMQDVVEAGFRKMPVLRARHYPKAADGEPAEHDRSGE